MLTSKQRAQLRKLANPLAVTLHIGKDGITEGVLSQLDVLLENHELVKGKVLENARRTGAVRGKRRGRCAGHRHQVRAVPAVIRPG